MAEPKSGRVAVPWQGRRIELAYREWPGESPTIVLLHGLASSSRIWDLVAPRLAERWRVVALDQRGHGRSDKPDEGYEFVQVTADLQAALDELGVEDAVLVGHSWGGNVALDYAARYPERIDGLGLVDGGFIELARRMEWSEAQERLRPPNTDAPLEQFRERLRGRLGARWSSTVEEMVMGNFWIDPDGIVRRNLSIEKHMRILSALYQHRPSDLFSRVGCPTLIVAAEPPDADAAQMAAKREMLKLAEERMGPRCRIVWMADTIHDVPVQRPDELAELLAELAQSARSSARSNDSPST